MPVDRAKAQHAIDAFLRALGRSPETEPDLASTAELVSRAWAEDLVHGYDVDVPRLLASEAMPAPPPPSGIVALRDLAVTTMCPHHLMPARGRASIFYLPGPSILGLGAIVRLLDAFAHRLTLQETLGQNIASALVQHLGARGAASWLSLSHTCLAARGERRDGAFETLVAEGSFATPGPDRDLFIAALGQRS